MQHRDNPTNSDLAAFEAEIKHDPVTAVRYRLRGTKRDGYEATLVEAYSLDAIARASEACAGDYVRFGYVDIRLEADTLSIWLDLRRSMLLELLAKGDVSGPTYAALERFTS